MGPFSAALIERFGVRNIVLTAVLLITGGLLGAVFMTEIWQLLVLWGLVVGVGTGSPHLCWEPSYRADGSRGTAVSCSACSRPVPPRGQLVFLPLAAWLVEHDGWRAAVVPSIVGLGITALFVVLFMCDRPSDVGLAPLGETDIAAPNAASNQRPAIAQAFGGLALASKSSTFWISAATFFICGLSTQRPDTDPLHSIVCRFRHATGRGGFGAGHDGYF